MRALLQRVARAEVRVDGSTVASIGPGMLILLGVGRGDDEASADGLAGKVARLRIFADENGKMNRSIGDVGGEALVVSQFTLFADARKGNRPSFVAAAVPEHADRLYERFAATLRGCGVPVATGTFRAAMQVELVGDGPVTIWLDSDSVPGGN